MVFEDGAFGRKLYRKDVTFMMGLVSLEEEQRESFPPLFYVLCSMGGHSEN